jgi:hypothetical protein
MRARADSTWAAHWADVARAAVDRLGPPWLVTGSGGRAELTLAPVGWWLAQAGFSAGSGGSGRLFARFVPLTVPAWSLRAITLSQADYQGDDAPPPGFDPAAENAVDVLCWWATYPAREHFADAEQYVRRREAAFDSPDRFERPIRWLELAGLRVIYGTGDPLPVIDAMFEGDLADDDDRAFWTEFRELATSGSRADQLVWLDSQRRRALAEFTIPDTVVDDVAAEAP